MLRNSIINLTLKIGLCFSFLYTALAALVVPERVVAHWPGFIVRLVSEQTLASFTGLCALALIIWLFSGSRKFESALTSTIVIAVTILFNFSIGGDSVSYIFSIVPLLSIGLALSLRYYPRIRVVVQTKVTPLTNVSPIDEHGRHPDEQSIDVTDLGASESTISASGIHVDHDQHLFIPHK